MFYERLGSFYTTFFENAKAASSRKMHFGGKVGWGYKKSILAVNYPIFAQNSNTNSQDAKKKEVDVTCHIFRSVTGFYFWPMIKGD